MANSLIGEKAKRVGLLSTVAPVVIAFVLGGLLLMLWPGLLALLFGILLVIQSCTAEQEVAVLSAVDAGLCSNCPPLSSWIRSFDLSSLRQRV